MIKVKRALVSVHDKTGVVSFAKALCALGIEVLSTGGTAALLKKEGVPVTEVSEVTQFPEMLDGRVKTLHPRLHAGILALRDSPEHLRTLEKHGIAPIDLVAVALYPFADAVRTKTDERDILEMIDIGGPAMLRAAAKNFRFVAALSDPADYDGVIRELKSGAGSLNERTSRRLAAKVFERTAAYDGMIRDYFSGEPTGQKENGQALPAEIDFRFKKIQDLRYGENPHQRGALYAQGSARGVVNARQLHGKELSFNNFLDLDIAVEMARAFEQPACAIVKHASPCGFALGADPLSAFRRAWACDPLSAFGSIVGFNRAVDAKTAARILKSGFVECVIAEGFETPAQEILKQKKNLRLLELKDTAAAGFDFKKVDGGLLLQDRDTRDPSEAELKCVTKTAPKKSQIPDLLFAFKVCRAVKSNAIVVAKTQATVGLGMGQPSRVDSCITAFRKAGTRARGAVLASDGFFPKPDSILLAKKAGISAIIQPGGSIQDEEIIKACDRAKISMVFTGIRHFKH